MRKHKAQISFATAKLISIFVFATQIVQFLYFLNLKFPASSNLLCLNRPVCVAPVQKPHCWFSHAAAHMVILRSLHQQVSRSGPSCSKLTMSLVNVSLKFQTLILQIHCYFLLKKCENPLHCKGFSHFFNKK